MDNGDGENLENLSTCFGIPRTEPFFSRNCPSLMFPNCYKRGSRLSPTRPGATTAELSLAARRTFPQHDLSEAPRV